jgi:hypothetical protein
VEGTGALGGAGDVKGEDEGATGQAGVVEVARAE